MDVCSLSAVEMLEKCKVLADAFVQLVASTKVLVSKQLSKVAITHSGRFMGIINRRVLPMIDHHFEAPGRVVGRLRVGGRGAPLRQPRPQA